MKNTLLILWLSSILLGCGNGPQEKLKLVDGHAVVGTDTRTQVSSLKIKHHLSIGWLKSSNHKSGIFGGCTASIIGKNLLLTAAHCVTKEDEKTSEYTLYDEIKFLSNFVGTVDQKTSTYFIKKAWIHKQFNYKDSEIGYTSVASRKFFQL
jgi:V8-like Glu-specific endopeptidase